MFQVQPTLYQFVQQQQQQQQESEVKTEAKFAIAFRSKVLYGDRLKKIIQQII